MNHLGNYVRKYKKKSTEINLFPMESEKDLEISYQILKGDYEYLQSYIIQHGLNSRQDLVQKVLNGLYLGQHALHEIYDHLITPVMHRLGRMWETGELSVIEEHFASQTVRDALIRLQGIIRDPEKKVGSAICLNLSSELHDIALKMVANILELRGYHIYFSGQYTDLFGVEQAFIRCHPDRVYLSCTWVEDVEKTQSELNVILENAEKYDSDVYIGGQGIYLLNLKHPRIVKIIQSFEEVHGKKAALAIAKAERYRIDNDPIKKLLRRIGQR